ncbi:hypothetical protein MAR_008434 [Mya arenaria]|uniref:Uncharacterized protein n=1 Tax=Mya arenaria TaxID=6604 RepID=A0ABY7E048_MYAAR|nr:hypothetical protein MAR_008434 [Mya arenaria]
MSTASAEVAGTQEEEGTVVEHGERDITPGESSDGGASGQVSESERSSEVSKTAGQEKGLGDGAADLDKDIDAMIDINVQNGQVDPDDWNIENINVDLSASSTINVLVPENASADTGIERDSGGEVGADNAAAGRDVTDAASEISVTSDATDSSLLAEAVVKKVIDSAVSLIKADQVEEDDTTDNTDGNTAINVAKVGLFQYGADSDKEESEETDDEISDVSGGENGSKDGKEKYDHSGDTAVGLFQYADMEETDRSKSPEVSELDENEDEVVDSMNDEEKANIMKLYGLEDVEEVSPASPKSASSSENGDGQSAFENKKEETVFDVQRQVYEPQARSFSVNRDPSTTDSSPRLDSQEGFGKPEGREKSEIDIELEFNEKHFGDEQEFEQSIETENAKKASMSPPLVQYESVTENGKFRIIKTAKDSAGIRVGADLLSPKVSPKTSPRDSEQSDEKNEVKLNKRSESHDTVERKKEKVAEVVEDVLGADRINVESWKVDDRGRSDSHQLETESSLDMEKIRALLAKENHLDEVGRPGISTREDGSGQRDSGKSPLSHGEHARKDRSYEKDESDRLASDSRYLEVTDSQYLQDTDRYASYDSTRDSSRFQSTYEEELLRRAYDRVPDTTGSRDITGSRDVTGSRDITGSRDTSKNSAHSRSHDSGVIPGFKTLQQQQAKWTDMFETLENDHRRDLRSHLRGLQEGDLATERPRAGVYSSPMPLMGRMTQSVRAEPVSSSRDTTRDSTRLTRSLHEPAHIPGFSMDRAELYGGEDRRRQELNDSVRSDDSQLSYNTRINLREKHAKHLNDLRAYYEDELRELRRALSDALEGTTSEYAAAYTDSKTMGIQHRAHIEELQRYCRERDELINELESRMVNRYESLEQEFKLLQETMSATENKLYETRTDVVELNRTISKLELENKRLGRENDNLRHKVTQSLNLSTLHDSFGGPASPRDAHPARRSKSPPPTNINQSHSSKTPPEPTTDHRVPMFATSMNDWTPIIQKSKGKTPTSAVDRSRLDKSGSSSLTDLTREQRSSKSKKVEESPSLKGRQPSKSARSAREETVSSREDVSHRSQTRPKTAPEEPTRDRPRLREITPPRAMSPASQADSEVSDYSPLLKAERDLYKLRDMMRQAVAVKPSFSPPPLKLQKKFYGSERPSQKDEYTPELGVARGRKESPALSGHGKSKSSQTPSRADKPSGEKSSSRKSGSSKGEKGSEKGSKSRDRGERDRKRDDERKRDYEKNRDSEEGKVKARERQKDEDSRERSKDGEPTKSKDRDRRRDRGDSPVRNGDINSSTRFNIDFNEDMKTVTVTPRKRDSQSNKQKNLSEAGVQTRDGEPGRTNGERQGRT